MDTAGKDSLIRKVFEEFNARGVEVKSFKTPTKLELQHVYLWRHNRNLPAKGKFSLFNRTHYENVLVTRVHPEYMESEIPGVKNSEDIPTTFWKCRYKQINNFEKHLTDNKMIVFKFFRNLSRGTKKTTDKKIGEGKTQLEVFARRFRRTRALGSIYGILSSNNTGN